MFRRLREVKYVTRNACERPLLFMPLDQGGRTLHRRASAAKFIYFPVFVWSFWLKPFLHFCLMHPEWTVFKHS